MSKFLYDYHSHTTASDGALTPTELFNMAAEAGVDSCAITDHDTVAGLAERQAAAAKADIEFITGVELSVNWANSEYHLGGIGMDVEHERFAHLIEEQQAARKKRAQIMGQRLDKACGTNNDYEQACELAGTGAPGRPFFAQWLVSIQAVRDHEHAFNRFLRQGRSAFVKTPWVSLADATTIIKEAGGVAVLAHPLQYRLTKMKLRRLLAEFCTMGGKGLEVALPRLSVQQEQLMYDCLKEFPLYASGGTDFHHPKQTWLTLGQLPALREGTPFIRSLLCS